jgi:hypothetical protein
MATIPCSTRRRWRGRPDPIATGPQRHLAPSATIGTLCWPRSEQQEGGGGLHRHRPWSRARVVPAAASNCGEVRGREGGTVAARVGATRAALEHKSNAGWGGGSESHHRGI